MSTPATSEVYRWCVRADDFGIGCRPVIRPAKFLNHVRSGIFGRGTYPDGTTIGVSEALTWGTLREAFEAVALRCGSDLFDLAENAASQGIDIASPTAAETEHLRQSVAEGGG